MFAKTPQKLIVGLGNPGQEYENNRHNIGFVVLKELCKKIHTNNFKKKRSYFIANKNDWLFLIPRTFMNFSGIAVRKAFRKYNITLNNLLIVLDDVNLPLGKIRIRESGSDGGHNGLKSIISELNSQDFPRVRMGIATQISENADRLISLKEFVLSDFTEDENKILKNTIPQAVNLISHFLFQNYKKMSNAFSQISSLSVS
ncbi:MAG: aminoacyl-tRNA hydrolase [Candidatus Cloacimonetes bacterium]|nr:aminoacyl-tRNA hydrolase [Candidatus Cloacimonadota bacterium]